MYRITKEFHFSASHVLDGLPDGHPCGRLHGHNYVVEVDLAAYALDEVGFVLDYRAMDEFKAWLDGTCDHRHLNDVLPGNPTAENMARLFFGRASELMGERVSAVRVRETPKTCAEYAP